MQFYITVFLENKEWATLLSLFKFI